MKVQKGDKFIIEIEDKILTPKGEYLYKIKGFNALVFDEEGLRRLDQISADKIAEIKRIAEALEHIVPFFKERTIVK